MNAPTIDPEADRDAWLGLRRGGVGASESAAVLGVSPYATPLEVYLRKVGDAPERAETAAMRRGRWKEPHLLDLYEEAHGGPISRQVFARHPELPFLFATPDAIDAQGRVVEVKTADRHNLKGWGEPGTDEVPDHYLVQVQHQLLATGLEAAVLWAELGGCEPVAYPIRRSEAVVARIRDEVARFWGRVERRDPPPPSLPADERHLPRLYGRGDGAVALPAEVAALVERHEALGRDAASWKEAEAERKALKARIVEALGPAAAGRLPDGRLVTRRLVEVAPDPTPGPRPGHSYYLIRVHEGVHA